MTRNKKPASKARRLHRFLATGLAVFIIFMVITGIAINHSNDLGLDRQHVSRPFLLDWYGLGEPEEILSFPIGDHWLSFAGSQVYLNDQTVSSLDNGVGAVYSGDMLIVAGSDELLLLDKDGSLIERQPWALHASTPIASIGRLQDNTITVKSAGLLWVADDELVSWQQATDTSLNPQWAVAETTPEVLQPGITRQYRGEGPSLERVLLDFHSGRIFGKAGILIYDLLALGLLFLSVSGLIIWFRGRKNGKR